MHLFLFRLNLVLALGPFPEILERSWAEIMIIRFSFIGCF